MDVVLLSVVFWQQAENGLNTEDLVDHIQGLEWKKEPLLVEFSANDKVE